jgi:hypothetical protein
LLTVYFLFPSNVGRFRKRQVVNEVLGWAGDNLPENHLVSLAFDHGIGSGNHKRRVIAAFTGLVQDEHEDADCQLLAIRQGLEALMPGKTLDFYWSPLEAAWYDSSEGGLADGAALEIIQHKKQVVLYGPPGTGKTYRAKRLAERIIRSSALVTMGPARYFQSQSAIDDALKSNIHRLQLHPAYSYEDFVRGLHISANGATEYRPGYLLRLIDALNQEPRESRLPHVLILDEMNRTDLSRMLGECFSLLEDRNQTIELPAHNGEGATFVIGTMNLIDQSVEQIDFALRRCFLWMLCPFDAEALMGAAKSRWAELKSGLDCGRGWKRISASSRERPRPSTGKFMTARCLALNTRSAIPTFLMWWFFYETSSAPGPRASTTTCGTGAVMPLSRSFRSGVYRFVLCWNNIWRDSMQMPATPSWSACPRFCSSQRGMCEDSRPRLLPLAAAAYGR